MDRIKYAVEMSEKNLKYFNICFMNLAKDLKS